MILVVVHCATCGIIGAFLDATEYRANALADAHATGRAHGTWTRRIEMPA